MLFGWLACALALTSAAEKTEGLLIIVARNAALSTSVGLICEIGTPKYARDAASMP